MRPTARRVLASPASAQLFSQWRALVTRGRGSGMPSTHQLPGAADALWGLCAAHVHEHHHPNHDRICGCDGGPRVPPAPPAAPHLIDWFDGSTTSSITTTYRVGRAIDLWHLVYLICGQVQHPLLARGKSCIGCTGNYSSRNILLGRRLRS
eukprot:6379064-Pyramimonas_sp.AAC.2